MSDGRGSFARESAEYAEVIADVFVEAIHKSANDAVSHNFEQEEITPSLMECLQYVYLHGASHIRQIATGLEITLSAASQLVDRLFKKDLVTRKETEEDRRLSKIELTPAGEMAVKKMRERRTGWFQSILSAMPEDKRNSLLDGIESFLQIALAGEDKVDRACVRCGIEHANFCVVYKLKNKILETG